MSEWENLLWGDIITLEYGKSLKKNDRVKGRHQVFGSNGPIGWSEKKLTEGPGVILGRKGAYRGIEYSEKDFWVIDTAYYAKLKREIDMRWLYYAMKGYKLGEIDDGSPIPSTPRAFVYKEKLSLPPLPEQKAIAKILTDLDDKIELNRKMNQTLEEMAQALFKSWFVNFDPVLDNALAVGNEIPEALQIKVAKRKAVPEAKKLLHTNPALAELFPDRFVFNEELEKWIPEGWEVNLLDEVIEIIGGGTPKTSIEDYWNGTIPWFSVVDAPRDEDVFVLSTEKTITELGVAKSSTKVLEEGVTIISARGTVGKCALVGVPMAMNQSCYGIRSALGCSLFNYYLLRKNVSDLQNKGHGSVFNTITKDTFKAIRVVIPSPLIVLAEFERICESYLSKIKSNLQQIDSLGKERDSLLPQLISGKLRVPDALLNTEQEIETT